MVDKIFIDGVIRNMTSEEQKKLDDERAFENSSSQKLLRIKEIRQQHLNTTDWWVFRGEMTSEQTAWRKSLRDIPQNYSEDKYDELLAKDKQGNLTHSVWSKP
tara:strand:+ start:188 stop:496 length:309 start_codon:yes stop_codon:yes gene_type:complete